MPRETVAEKAERLWQAGAVTLHDELHTEGEPPVYWLHVTGDNHTYTVTAQDTKLTCDCPANTDCAHQGAAALWLERGAPQVSGSGEPSSSGAGNEPSTVDSPPHVELLETPDPGRPSLAVYSEPPAELGAMFLSPIKDFRNQAWGTLTQITDPKAGMVPKQYQGKPAAALAALFLGRDWGLGPVESLQYIDVIDGSVQPSAELRLRKYRAAGHKIRIDDEADDHITITGIRGDNDDELTVTYSIHDAAKMGRLTVTDKGEVKSRSKQGAPMIWEKDTADMLWWGAVRRLVRRLAPDCMDRTPGGRAQ